jgi:hypothetical protein
MLKMPPLHETLHHWHARALENGTKQASLFAVGIPFIIISSVVVFLRLYVRLRLVRLRLAADDCKLYIVAQRYHYDADLSKTRSDACWYTLHDCTLDR